MQCRIGLHLTY